MHKSKTFLALSLITLAVAVRADVPPRPSAFDVVPFRGHLERGTQPWADTVTMRFRLYADATITTPLYEQQLDVTPSAQGDFAVQLGPSGTDASGATVYLGSVLSAHAQAFVGIAITEDGSTVELAQRQQLLSAPFAARVAHVHSDDIEDGEVKSADIADGQVTSIDIGDGEVTSTDIGTAAIQANHLSNLGCATNQVIRFNGTRWECVDRVAPAITIGSDIGCSADYSTPTNISSSTTCTLAADNGRTVCFLTYNSVTVANTSAVGWVSCDINIDGGYYKLVARPSLYLGADCSARCISW